MKLDRRTALLAVLSGGLAACGRVGGVGSQERPEGTRTLTYGDDPSQFGELSLPAGEPRGVVVVIHGGFWSNAYGLDLGRPLATSLVAEGWAVWNLEYRRVGAGEGGGGGTPATFDDVLAGVERLREVPAAELGGLDLAGGEVSVLALGHSAGGHLAVWVAGESDLVTGVVAQAGVLDLVAADREGLGSGAVAALLGGPPGPATATYDPVQQVPLAVPVRCVHGRDDVIVPLSQSQSYVDAATAAGAEADLTEVDGDHFVVIDPDSPAWRTQLDLLAELAG